MDVLSDKCSRDRCPQRLDEVVRLGEECSARDPTSGDTTESEDEDDAQKAKRKKERCVRESRECVWSANSVSKEKELRVVSQSRATIHHEYELRLPFVIRDS